jgi:2,3-dihydroxybenzoate decarboxylase
MCSAVALMGAIGIDNVMFAVDYPYESTSEAVAFLDSAPGRPGPRPRLARQR